jgi:hypothetical protein
MNVAISSKRNLALAGEKREKSSEFVETRKSIRVQQAALS